MKTRIQQYIVPFMILMMLSPAAMAEPMISLGGNRYNDAETLEEARFYAYLLGMDEKVVIRVNFSPNLPKGVQGTVSHKLLENEMVQVVITINRRAGRASQMMTLAHEMVHARQFINEELVILDDNRVQWKDGEIYDLRKTNYHDRPWEEEAVEEGLRLRRQFLGIKRVTTVF